MGGILSVITVAGLAHAGAGVGGSPGRIYKGEAAGLLGLAPARTSFAQPGDVEKMSMTRGRREEPLIQPAFEW
jgi:hypothetical protein